MIQDTDIYGVNYFRYGEAFYGSDTGMRYRIEKNQEEVPEGQEKPSPRLKVTIWPEPMGYDATGDKEKETNYFSFDSQGRDEMIAWLNEKHQEEKFRWIR